MKTLKRYDFEFPWVDLDEGELITFKDHLLVTADMEKVIDKLKMKIAELENDLYFAKEEK